MTSRDKVTEEWLAGVVAGLGRTADEVAATLRAANITGTPNEPGTCPVARYVAARVAELAPPGQVMITVTSYVMVSIDPPEGDYQSAVTPTPEPVNAFIEAFDIDGEYTDLVDSSG